MNAPPDEADVVVVGGGAAGIAAAVAAARNGASVVLLEKYGFFGGMATAGMVGTVCGLYNIGPTPRWTSHGFAREFGERLATMCGTKPVHAPGDVHFLPYDKFQFQLLADQLIKEHPGITPGFHSTISDTMKADGRIGAVRGIGWDHEYSVRGKTYVDATGEATLISISGGETIDHWERNAKSVTFQIDRVGPSGRGYTGRLAVLREIAHAVDAGSLPRELLYTTYIQPAENDDVAAFKLVIPAQPNDGSSRMTSLEFAGRALIAEFFAYLKNHVGAFADARICDVADQAGVRIGRCLAGPPGLTEDNVLTAAKTPDGIARGAWPIEFWEPDGRPVMRYPPPADYYEIGVNALFCAGLGNVYAAGRCISADPGALASARVIGIALSTGWAAGTLAAYQALGKNQSEAVAKIRRENAGES